MKVDRYLQYVAGIEERLRELRLDAIVFGMGPTGWLLPWIDQRLLEGVRLWGCHDGCRIMPAHDLVLMDPPVRALHEDTSRFAHIVASRPRRIWCIDTAWEVVKSRNPDGTPAKVVGLWQKHLAPAVQGLVTVQRYRVWNPEIHPKLVKPELGNVNKHGVNCPDTIAVSPTGATALAWSQGCRRIGVIGADMMRDHHHTWSRWPQVDRFFTAIANQAHANGGVIANLSPITSLKEFAAWKPPASSLEPISGSATQELKLCSSAPSVAMPPAQSTSAG